MRLSAVIIAKNSEKLLRDCIESVNFCDEIIVVDAHSIDKTKEVAIKLGARVVKGEDNDFAKQRSIGKNEAKGEWILYIDTDERVTKELREQIIQAISSDMYAAYIIKRKNFYLGNHLWPKIEKLERLFQKKSLEEWYGTLHETAKVNGKIGELQGYLLHYTHRNLEEMLDKTITWSKTEANLRLKIKHPPVVWWRLIRVMITGFIDSYIQQGGWKIGTAGLIESMYQSFSMLITYVSLWELQKEKRHD